MRYPVSEFDESPCGPQRRLADLGQDAARSTAGSGRPVAVSTGRLEI